jgi:hypothetical protein
MRNLPFGCIRDKNRRTGAIRSQGHDDKSRAMAVRWPYLRIADGDIVPACIGNSVLLIPSSATRAWVALR